MPKPPHRPEESLPPSSAELAPELAQKLGGGEVRLAHAPGRVNLMGGHTDYNEGLVLPVAVDLECLVAFRPASDGYLSLRSTEYDHAAQLPADGSSEVPQAPTWIRLIGGLARELAVRGRPPVGMKAIVGSTLPLGSGLSSSAAFEVAAASALCNVADFDIDPSELAAACRAAEETATGVPCGIMDQMAAVYGKRDHALLIDCRSLRVAPVPLPEDLGIVVIHSGIPRDLADTPYSERRRHCEELAERFKVPALRDALPEQVVQDPLGRHVVSEIARVQQTAAALAEGDRSRLAELFAQSQASLRDDYQVSTDDLDSLVECLLEAGAVGARITGAGFGGCVVALADRHARAQVAGEAAGYYRTRTGKKPSTFLPRAADGAGVFLLRKSRRSRT